MGAGGEIFLGIVLTIFAVFSLSLAYASTHWRK